MEVDHSAKRNRNLGRLVPVGEGGETTAKKVKDFVSTDANQIANIVAVQTQEAEVQVVLEGGVNFRPLCISSCGSRAWAADRTSFRLCGYLPSLFRVRVS